MQSLHWSEMKRRHGLNSVHFGIFDGDRLDGGAIFYTSKTLQGAGILVAPEGPVLQWEDAHLSTLQLCALTEAVQTYANENGIMTMRIEPRLTPPQPPLLREFGRAPVDLVPCETLYLDLRPSEDEILAGMKPKGRYNIKIAERNQVVISAHQNKDVVGEYFDAVTQASLRNSFALESPPFFEELADVLCASKHAEFLLAKHEDDLLGALILINYGQRATYLYGGTTDVKRELMGGYALQWAAIRKARKLGCLTYDFYGYVEHRAPDHEYARFSQFKSQFGGRSIRFIGGQDYFFLDNVAKAFVKAAAEISRYSADPEKKVSRFKDKKKR